MSIVLKGWYADPFITFYVESEFLIWQYNINLFHFSVYAEFGR
jgi:hypothetical protein